MSNNIEIIELSKRPHKDYLYSQLILQIKGQSINETVVNCLRRISYRNIPTYAFCDQSINIEFNDSIYNNDYMRLRLTQLPVFDIDNKIEFLPNKYWENVDYSDNKREKHPDDKKTIEIFINAHNDTAMNTNVTSDSIKYYIDGEKTDNKLAKIKPLLIIQLKPNQTFKAKAKAVLGVGEGGDQWAAASNCYYDKTDENSYKFMIESQGQMDEYEILVKACRIAQKKLQDISQLVSDSYKGTKIQKGKLIELVLTREDNTIGNVINDGLQNHSQVTYSGVSKPDLLIKEIIIKMISTSSDPLSPFFDVIKEKTELFVLLEKQFTKLGKKYIN